MKRRENKEELSEKELKSVSAGCGGKKEEKKPQTYNVQPHWAPTCDNKFWMSGYYGMNHSCKNCIHFNHKDNKCYREFEDHPVFRPSDH